jgi:CheY-like chemotaxis protein
MAQYKILYVDEVESERNRFLRYIHKNDDEKEFVTDALEPLPKLEEFLEIILNNNYDAIITDHKLSEANPHIQYDGLELVEAILKNRIDFPCFVLTSFDDDAVRDGDDVNIVYIKGLMTNEEGHLAKFIYKIKNQIKHHQKKIEKVKEELKGLIKKEYLDAKDEARLLELDTYLEKTTNIKSSLPPQLKSLSHLNELHKMIENTDKLLAELKGR